MTATFARTLSQSTGLGLCTGRMRRVRFVGGVQASQLQGSDVLDDPTLKDTIDRRSHRTQIPLARFQMASRTRGESWDRCIVPSSDGSTRAMTRAPQQPSMPGGASLGIRGDVSSSAFQLESRCYHQLQRKRAEPAGLLRQLSALKRHEARRQLDVGRLLSRGAIALLTSVSGLAVQIAVRRGRGPGS
jgi:hypothetical protein